MAIFWTDKDSYVLNLIYGWYLLLSVFLPPANEVSHLSVCSQVDLCLDGGGSLRKEGVCKGGLCERGTLIGVSVKRGLCERGLCPRSKHKIKIESTSANTSAVLNYLNTYGAWYFNKRFHAKICEIMTKFDQYFEFELTITKSLIPSSSTQ